MTNDINLKEFIEIKSNVAMLLRHEIEDREKQKQWELALIEMNTNIKLLTKEVKGIPEIVRGMEIENAKKEGYVSALKVTTGILIGVLISIVAKNSFPAYNKEEKDNYKKEVSR